MATSNKAATAAQKPVAENQQSQSETAPAPEKAPRTRNSLSMERRLALALIAVLNLADVGKLKGPEIDAAKLLVKDVNEKIVKPTQDRIATLKTEFAAVTKDPATINLAKVIEISKELERLEKKLKTMQATS